MDKYLISAPNKRMANYLAENAGLRYPQWEYIPIKLVCGIRREILGRRVKHESFLIGHFTDVEKNYLLSRTEKTIERFSFSVALELLKEGKRVKRKDWGGYWFIPEYNVIGERINGELHARTVNKTIMACLKDDGGYVPAQPYQADMLAEDWELVV